MALELLLRKRKVTFTTDNADFTDGNAMRLPESIWEHRLFADSARFLPAPVPFLPAMLDYRIRKLKNMPSCSDETESQVGREVDNVLNMTRKWILDSTANDSKELRGALEQADRILRIMNDGVIQEDALMRAASRQADLMLNTIGVPNAIRIKAPEAPAEKLAWSVRLFLDHAMLADPHTRRRYASRLYRAMNAALDYNATSDATRNTMVINDIRALLIEEGVSGASFLDSGCSFSTGAANTLLAARILRAGNVCKQIHGTDVAPPDQQWARKMAHEHHVLFFQANPVLKTMSQRYDVILLANVHRHLDRPLQERLLTNLGKSLTESGYLVINWRFSADDSPTIFLHRSGDDLIMHEVDESHVLVPV